MWNSTDLTGGKTDGKKNKYCQSYFVVSLLMGLDTNFGV